MQYAVLGVNFFNKGAELMLCAVKQQVEEWENNSILGCPISMCSFKDRNKAKLKHVLCRSKRSEVLKEEVILATGHFIPKEIRYQNNLVLESEVDTFLDASGFVFGDQWPIEKALKMLELCRNWRSQGKKVILLPQAFGPFKKQDTKKVFVELIQNVDLAFARDTQSYEYISQLNVPLEQIKISPDFTNLVKPEEPDYIDKLASRPCIIPNQKMIDKTTKEIGQSYIMLLETALKYLVDRNLNPFILLHESYDIEICNLLEDRLSIKNLIIKENNPLYLKGIINRCCFTIGSRFHGLVSALSQGTPTIGTGWSHKYQMLFKDYECPEMLVKPRRDPSSYLSKIDLLIDESTRKQRSLKLLEISDRQKSLSRQMWSEVEKVIL